MKLYANRRLRVKKNTVTLISRTLPGKGKIFVSSGQIVSPEEIIGRSVTASGFRIVNLAKDLQVSPKDCQNYFKVKIGDKVFKGELLAIKPKGFFGEPKVAVSPTDGLVDFFDERTGLLRISFLPKSVELPAAVFGIVEKVDESEQTVWIKTMVDQVFGLFGSGRIREGVLSILGPRGGLLSGKTLSPEHAEHIIVGGGSILDDALSTGLSYGVGGLISGSINAQSFKAVAGGRIDFSRLGKTDIGVSLIATEGFGRVAIGEDIFDVLEEHKGKFAILNGNLSLLALPVYDKTLLDKVKNIKLAKMTDEDLVSQADPLAVEVLVGQTARVVASPFMGEQGKITAIDQTPTTLPSGISTYLLTLETKMRQVRVPYSNIEVLQ